MAVLCATRRRSGAGNLADQARQRQDEDTRPSFESARRLAQSKSSALTVNGIRGASWTAVVLYRSALFPQC